MWVACRDGRLLRIDPRTNETSVTSFVGATPSGLGYGFASVWWINASEAGGVSRIDPVAGDVTEFGAPYARFVIPTKRFVWLVGITGDAFKIDPANAGGSTRPVRKTRVALGATYARGTIWINDGDLVAFDAHTGRVTLRRHVASHQNWRAVAGIAVLGDDVWLVDPRGQRIIAVTV